MQVEIEDEDDIRGLLNKWIKYYEDGEDLDHIDITWTESDNDYLLMLDFVVKPSAYSKSSSLARYGHLETVGCICKNDPDNLE